MSTTDPKDILIHEGDTPLLEFECINKSTGAPADISNVGVKTLILKPPLGATAIERDLVFINDGVDGLVKYQCVDGDIVGFGAWYAEIYTTEDQLVFTYSGGRFMVEEVLRGT